MKCRWNQALITVLATALVLSIASVVFAQGVRPPQTAGQEIVSFRAKDAPIRSVIEDLLRPLGYSYAIDPNLTGNVTVTLIDVAFNDALAAILKAANATVRREGGIYIFGPQRELPGMVPTPLSMAEEIPIQREKITEKITVGYLDASQVQGILGGGGGGTGAGMGGIGGGGIGGGGIGGGGIGGGGIGGIGGAGIGGGGGVGFSGRQGQ